MEEGQREAGGGADLFQTAWFKASKTLSESIDVTNRSMPFMEQIHWF